MQDSVNRQTSGSDGTGALVTLGQADG